MGVDVFSAGNFSEKAPGTDAVRYEDPALGIYKKLTVRDGKLAGVILVGDTSDSHRYMDWLRSQTDLTAMRRQLLFPGPANDAGLDVAEMADSKVVCGCNGVTKGAIIQAVHEKGISTLAQLKDCTRASTGCGSCTEVCQQQLKAVEPEFQEEAKRTSASASYFPRTSCAKFCGARGCARCRKFWKSMETAWAAKSASRRSVTWWTCCGAETTMKIARRASSTTASTPIFKRTERFLSCRASVEA